MADARTARATACLLTATLALAGCAMTPSTGTAAPTSAASAPPEPGIAGTFEIGDDRRMYLECTGSGSPTVVLISGQRGSAGDWVITAEGVDSPPVFDLVAEHTRVCAYDRPGTVAGELLSRSDPIVQPATAAGMAADLHALLRAAGVALPVVVVGHSAGGLAARLFAAEHPDEVAGMVLVDALGEGLQENMTTAQWQIQRPLLKGYIEEALTEYPDLEWVDADASFDQVRAAPRLRQMPLIVLSADEPIGPEIPGLKAAGTIGADIPDDFGYVTDAAQSASQAAQAALVRGSVHITETDSGHNVHIEQPELVAGAIVQVVDRVRAGADTAR